MAAGIVILGFDGEKWLTLSSPSTPIDEAKALYREIKIKGGNIDGVEYAEIRKYTNQGCQRLRFKGKGIVSVDVTPPQAPEEEPVFAKSKKELQDALGIKDEAFKALWGTEGRPQKYDDGYLVGEFVAFGVSLGIMNDEPVETGTGEEPE